MRSVHMEIEPANVVAVIDCQPLEQGGVGEELRCRRCGGLFKTPKTLRQHESSNCRGMQAWHCPTCLKQFSCHSDLQDHCTRSHPLPDNIHRTGMFCGISKEKMGKR